MNFYSNINLQFKSEKRSNYMSFKDLANDLKTESLIEIIEESDKYSDQMTCIKLIEQRDELNDDKFFDLLEKCNGK